MSSKAATIKTVCQTILQILQKRYSILSVYGKVKRRQSEYIFCSVTFDEGYKSYYYLTNDDSIEVGDFVIVPAEKDNHEAVVEVVNIEYFNDENAPLPAEKTKRIIRKCTDDDFDPPVE